MLTKLNSKKVLILSIEALVLLIVAAILVVTHRLNSSPTRYHDNWMPDDIEWTIYVDKELPSNSKGFDDDYFVISNVWDTYRKIDGSWERVGKLVEMEGASDDEIRWASQLYTLYCSTNRWYKGGTHEWVYDLRDGYLFETKFYDIHFYGEKQDDSSSIADYGIQKFRRREDAVYNGVPPVKQFDEQYFYSFDSWDHSLKNVVESFDTYAVFTEHKNGSLVKTNPDGSYRIGFNENDEIKQTISFIEIPEEISGHKITKIDDAAFSHCTNLQYIKLPSTIDYIGDHAFFACSSLKEIVIPKSVSYISDAAFSSALTSLESIKVEEGNPYYKDIDGVLYSIDGKTIKRYPPAKKHAGTVFEIDPNIKNISSFCFADLLDVEEFVLPVELKIIGTWAFKNTDISELKIPSKAKILSGNFISGCSKLETIDAVDSVNYSSIDGILYTKDLKTIYRIGEGKDLSQGFEIPAFVTTLGEYCFSGTNMKYIEIPKNIETIDCYCFSYLDYLENIYIPETVQNINLRAFYSCHYLTIDCQVSEQPMKWSSEWAYVKDLNTDPNDYGYVKKINFGA